MVARHASQQLSLDITDAPATSLPRRLRPAVPLPGPAPFDDADWFFEPWWPGTIVFASLGDEGLRIQSEHLADPLATFPELAAIDRQFGATGLIVEGTLLVLDDEGRPDAELLRRRLAADESAGGEPAIVAADLLHAGGRPLLGQPFEDRRARLTRLLTDGDRCVVSRGLRGEGVTLAAAAASMGVHEISARLLSAPYRPGQQDGSWLRLPVTETPAEPTRPLLALLQRLPL